MKDGKQFVADKCELTALIQKFITDRMSGTVTAYQLFVAITALHSAAESFECYLRTAAPDVVPMLEAIRDACAKHDRNTTAEIVAADIAGGALTKGGGS
jgi:hypothetical protein